MSRMSRALSPGARIELLLLAIAFFVGAIIFTQAIPPVEGLGDKVRLPMFHGGATWVNMMTFSLMGIFSLLYLFFRKEDLYRWASGFRWVSAPLWLANSIMGATAAASTWDFTGSNQTPLSVIRNDPRLLAQFHLLAALLIVLVLHFMFENRAFRAFLDVAFTVVFWGVLRGIFTSEAARALHPDSPVLNSGADIQTPFFGIVGCLFVAAMLAAWLIRDRMLRND